MKGKVHGRNRLLPNRDTKKVFTGVTEENQETLESRQPMSRPLLEQRSPEYKQEGLQIQKDAGGSGSGLF
jgi:hypothetical protein